MTNNVATKNLGGFAGYIQITVTDKDGNVSYDGKPFKNLLTDLLLNSALNSTSPATMTSYCGVGTSATAPAVTDTALGAQVGNRITVAGAYSTGASPTYISTLDRTFSFAQGAITGNIAEVGFFSNATGANCGSRALIKDSGGTPTTLTIISTDTLTIRYFLRYVPNIAGGSGTHVISGTNYAYTWLPKLSSAQHAYSNPLSYSVTYLVGFAHETQTIPSPGNEANPSLGDTSTVWGTYVNGTFYRDVTTTYAIGAGNHATGIGLISLAAGAQNYESGFYFSYTPKIPKDNTKTLALTYRVSYSRV